MRWRGKGGSHAEGHWYTNCASGRPPRRWGIGQGDPPKVARPATPGPGGWNDSVCCFQSHRKYCKKQGCMRDIRFGWGVCLWEPIKIWNRRALGHRVCAEHWQSCVADNSDTALYCTFWRLRLLTKILVCWLMIMFHLCMKFLFVYEEILA